MNALSVETSWRTLSGNIALAELNQLEKFGCYPRLIYENREITNVEELSYAGRLAQVLKDRGVGPGDRVLVLLPNSPDLTAAFQAIWTVGAVIAPIIPSWTADEIVTVLANSEPTCVLTFPLVAPRLRAALTATKMRTSLLVFGETDVPGAENLYPAIAAAKPIETPLDRRDEDLAVLLYTSGTTASPRGAMLTHHNLKAAFDAMSSLNKDLPRGTMLHALPLSHSFGLLMLNLANGWGWSTVILRQFDPSKALESIQKHRVQYMPAVPTMLVYLLQHPELTTYDLSSLRRVISGGAALPEPIRAAFERVCGGRVEQGYGLSETVAVVTAYSDQDTYRTWSAGRPAPGVRVAVVGEENKLLGPKEVGEIVVAGPHVMSGYWKDPRSTEEAFFGEWLRTGDMGRIDEDGYLYITDRKKDLIIKGGENISPVEVEEALHAHPAIAAASVVGIPDSLFGENVCAVVQLKPGKTAEEEEVRNFVSERVGKFKAPVQVLFWTELPRNFAGKIWKRAIRTRLDEMKSASATT